MKKYKTEFKINISSFDKRNHDAVTKRIKDLIERMKHLQPKETPKDEYVWISYVEGYTIEEDGNNN